MTEQQIYEDFVFNGIAFIDAVELLQTYAGYCPKEAERIVYEWADYLQMRDELNEKLNDESFHPI